MSHYATLDAAGLATAAHHAEDTEDDIALMAVMEEVERRAEPVREAFRTAYIRQHRERREMQQRRGKA